MFVVKMNETSMFSRKHVPRSAAGALWTSRRCASRLCRQTAHCSGRRDAFPPGRCLAPGWQSATARCGAARRTTSPTTPWRRRRRPWNLPSRRPSAPGAAASRGRSPWTTPRVALASWVAGGAALPTTPVSSTGHRQIKTPHLIFTPLSEMATTAH